MSYSCTTSLLSQVTHLVNNADTAQTICSTFNCADTSAYFCVTQYLSEQASSLRTDVDSKASSDLAAGVDTFFVLFSAYLVFSMQIGFAMLCAGCVRSKNTMNILLKNILDSCVGGLCFYLFGYAFAYGHKLNRAGNPFIGSWNFALSYTSKVSTKDYGGADEPAFDGFGSMGWQSFFFQWSFAATATTIVSGAVAERCSLTAYLCYSAFMSILVYPVVVHWVWSPVGWLSAFNTSRDGYALILRTGAIDFAGSGVVHMVGGWAGLVGAYILGPRIGRFDASGKVNDLRGHNVPFVVLGTFLLWFGWYGFNPGSNLSISSRAAAVTVSRVAVTTTLAAAGGGVTALLAKFFYTNTWDIPATCNGVLAGLVSITAGCAVVEPWAAIVSGTVGAVIFLAAERLQLYVWRIDDPVSAWPLHGAVGAFGVLFPGLLAAPHFIEQVYGGSGFGADPRGSKRYGIFYGGHGQLLLAQTVEVVAVALWTSALMGALFVLLRLLRLLRVPLETELEGLDASKHGGAAYGYGTEASGREIAAPGSYYGITIPRAKVAPEGGAGDPPGAPVPAGGGGVRPGSRGMAIQLGAFFKSGFRTASFQQP